MTKIVFGTKLGMTASYQGETRVAVTRLALLPMTISQLKSVEKDGYSAAQVIVGGKHREINYDEGMTLKSVINPTDIVAVGAAVKITATSKGKGRAGVVKKWGFAGGPRTHGQSDRLRRAGSIGQGTTPGRVYKGKHMAGHMGTATVTVKSSMVLSFDATTNIAFVKGAVPGHTGSLVKLTIIA